MLRKKCKENLITDPHDIKDRDLKSKLKGTYLGYNPKVGGKSKVPNFGLRFY